MNRALVVLLTSLSFAAGGCGRSASGRSIDGGAKLDAPTGGGLGDGGAMATGGAGGTDGGPTSSGLGGKTAAGGISMPGGTSGAGGVTTTGGMAGTSGVPGTGGFCGGRCDGCSVYQCYNCACEHGEGGHPGMGGNGAGGASAVDASADARTVKVGDPCWSQNDCTFSLRCLAPGEFGGCGACRGSADQCSKDSDCEPDGGVTTGKRICATPPPRDCYCMNPLICQAGCRSNGDCPSGQACNAQNTCVKACTPGDSTCGADFECVSKGFCQQLTCTNNAECSGACVKGKCYSAPGTCQPPVA